MGHHLLISNINNILIDCRQYRYWKSIKLLLILVILTAHPAAAQAQFYVGGSVAADSADRGSMALRTVPVAGGLAGFRFNDRWSVEFHLDRGFAEGDPHGRIGFFGTDTLEDSARQGFAAFAIWKSRPFGRAALAASMGLAERRFRTTRTVGIDRPVNLPPNDPLLQGETRTTQVAGPTGGLLLPIALGGRWSVAPELRVGIHFSSEGIYGDGVYAPVYWGVRVMWGF